MSIAAITVMSLSGLAHGSVVHWSDLVGLDQDPTELGGRITIDISGYECWDFLGDPDNQTLDVFVGAGATITQLSWDLNLTTVGISWADEATITFNDVFSLNPGAGDAFTVSNMNYQGTIGTPLVLDGSGILHMEFHEIGFDDNPDAADSYFEAGSYIYIGMPSPGVLGVMGFGGLMSSRRRR